ncbi:MAG: ABC transporter ATP-binding protein [Thermoanaerobaculia bacterium]|nr:ABC transporter ATP-binding protein [Thermoanaerobaculia bacterium]
MLRIQNVSRTYGNGVQALKDVSLEIPRGMFGLLGPNGAGKSTLMRTIATLQGVDAGSLFFDNLDVLEEKHEVRKILGYLPQEMGIYPEVAAETLLDHFAVLKGIASAGARREVVAGLLRMTNLWDVRARKLGTFSGGMRRRFGIAQALLGDPELIIVDEPTAGLDPEERVRFLNLLSEIGESAVVILSTHIVDDVRELCSRMAILSRGRVLLHGEPGALVARLEGKVWRKVIGRGEVARYQESMPVLSTRLAAGRTVVHVLSDPSPGDGFEPAEPDLEHVYLATLHGS